MAKKIATERTRRQRLTVGNAATGSMYSEHPVSEIPLFCPAEKWLLLPWSDVLRVLKEHKAVSIECEPEESEQLKQSISALVEAAEERVMFRYDRLAKRLWAWLWNASPFYGFPVESDDGEATWNCCLAAL